MRRWADAVSGRQTAPACSGGPAPRGGAGPRLGWRALGLSGGNRDLPAVAGRVLDILRDLDNVVGARRERAAAHRGPGRRRCDGGGHRRAGRGRAALGGVAVQAYDDSAWGRATADANGRFILGVLARLLARARSRLPRQPGHPLGADAADFCDADVVEVPNEDAALTGVSVRLEAGARLSGRTWTTARAWATPWCGRGRRRHPQPRRLAHPHGDRRLLRGDRARHPGRRRRRRLGAVVRRGQPRPVHRAGLRDRGRVVVHGATSGGHRPGPWAARWDPRRRDGPRPQVRYRAQKWRSTPAARSSTSPTTPAATSRSDCLPATSCPGSTATARPHLLADADRPDTFPLPRTRAVVSDADLFPPAEAVLSFRFLDPTTGDRPRDAGPSLQRHPHRRARRRRR